MPNFFRAPSIQKTSQPKANNMRTTKTREINHIFYVPIAIWILRSRVLFHHYFRIKCSPNSARKKLPDYLRADNESNFSEYTEISPKTFYFSPASGILQTVNSRLSTRQTHRGVHTEHIIIRIIPSDMNSPTTTTTTRVFSKPMLPAKSSSNSSKPRAVPLIIYNLITAYFGCMSVYQITSDSREIKSIFVSNLNAF